jgi:hypothetical protein
MVGATTAKMCGDSSVRYTLVSSEIKFLNAWTCACFVHSKEFHQAHYETMDVGCSNHSTSDTFKLKSVIFVQDMMYASVGRMLEEEHSRIVTLC